MPIKRCILPSGKSGYKWGNSGKCYPTREQALEQMRAIKVNQSKGIAEQALEELKKNVEQNKPPR